MLFAPNNLLLCSKINQDNLGEIDDKGVKGLKHIEKQFEFDILIAFFFYFKLNNN